MIKQELLDKFGKQDETTLKILLSHAKEEFSKMVKINDMQSLIDTIDTLDFLLNKHESK